MEIKGGGNSSVESTSAQDASEVPESAEASQEGGSTQAVAEGTATGSIEVEVGYTDQDLEKFQAIVDAFVEESGIDVQLVTPGSDFETVMKTRMASGDLPDIWTTHGWSVARYSEYLMPLNEESWYDRIDPSAMGVIEDDGGNIYVLPVSQVVSGVIYNMDTLTEAGVDPTEIRTLADFEEACEKVKALGKTPIHVGGKDNSNAAGFLGSIAPAMLTDEGCEYPNGDALKDGTFDWDTYGTPVMQKIEFSQLKFLYPLKTLVFPAFSPPRFGPFPSFFPLREEMRETFFRPFLQPYPAALRKFVWPLWWRGRKCSLWYLHQNVPAAPAHPWVLPREREGWSYMYASTDESENHPYPRSSFGSIGIRC